MTVALDLLVKSFGIGVVTLGALTYLAKVIIESMVGRSNRTFAARMDAHAAETLTKLKVDLDAAANTRLEELRGSLHLRAIEHEVAFRALQAKQCSVAADAFGRLVELGRATRFFAEFEAYQGDRVDATKRISELRKSFTVFFAGSRIYLPTDVCAEIDSLDRAMDQHLKHVNILVGREERPAPPEGRHFEQELRQKIDGLADETQVKLKALEETVRQILQAGLSTHSAVVEPTSAHMSTSNL